jgi:hypothetical protein
VPSRRHVLITCVVCATVSVCYNFITILTETNAVLVFGQDIAREEIVLVCVEALEFIYK